MRRYTYLAVAVAVSGVSCSETGSDDSGRAENADEIGDVVSDDLGCPDPNFATAEGMATADDGTLYAVGSCGDAWIVRQRLPDEEWQTVDRFLHLGKQSSLARDVAVDAAGNVAVIGQAIDGLEVTGLVRASFDGGKTWQTVDEDPDPPATIANYPASIAVDSNGDILVAGNVKPTAGAPVWTIRRLGGGSGADRSMAEFASFVDPQIDVQGFHVADDKIYLRGVRPGPSPRNWVILRSSDAGVSWKELKAFSQSGAAILLNDLATSPDGVLHALGAARDPANGFAVTLVLRTSTDHGDTWVTHKRFDESEPLADARFLAVGEEGQVWVAGDALSLEEGGQLRRWLVRQSNDAGKTWATVQEIRSPTGLFAQIRGVFATRRGTHAFGSVQVDDGFRWLVTDVAGSVD